MTAVTDHPRLRFAIIGAGTIGPVHARALLDLSLDPPRLLGCRDGECSCDKEE